MLAVYRSVYTENATLGYRILAFLVRCFLNRGGFSDRFDSTRFEISIVDCVYTVATARASPLGRCNTVQPILSKHLRDNQNVCA